MGESSGSKRSKALLQILYVAQILHGGVNGLVPLQCQSLRSTRRRFQGSTPAQSLVLASNSFEIGHMNGSKRRRKVWQQRSKSVSLFDSNAWYDLTAANRTDHGSTALSCSLTMTEQNGVNTVPNFFTSSFTSNTNGAAVTAMATSNGEKDKNHSEQLLLSNENNRDLKRKIPAPTAPEVNKWTNIMARGKCVLSHR